MSTALDSYLNQRDIKDEAFAEAIGRHRSVVNKMRNGKTKPSLELAGLIERLTDGIVTMQSWTDRADNAGHVEGDGAQAAPVSPEMCASDFQQATA